MSGWTRHEGTAVALPLENIDTDQLIPARFMSTPRSQGYGSFLLYDLAHDADGQPVEDFPLIRHPKASVLVTRRNFGCGSSREAAVYSLVDHGIRTVIAPSFGDIFAANAINNGLLPAQIETEQVEALLEGLGDGEQAATVDLAVGVIRLLNHEFKFHLEEKQRDKLMNGWDDIDLTQSRADEIASFKTMYRQTAPWARPAGDQDFARQ